MKTATLALALLVAPAALAAPPFFFRAAIAAERSADTTVEDRDCSSTEPPALFGCVEGNDGRALAARGDFGTATSWEVAAGVELSAKARVELALTERRSLELDANANFPNVAEGQPVDAEAKSRSAFVIASYDVLAWGKVRPYVSAGAGIARNELGPVTYGFPSIAADAVTVTTGGTSTSFAWMTAAGVTFPLTGALSLDVALRYADLGELRTDDGEATIVRPRGTFVLDIAGTRADLRTTALNVGIRYRM